MSHCSRAPCPPVVALHKMDSSWAANGEGFGSQNKHSTATALHLLSESPETLIW